MNLVSADQNSPALRALLSRAQRPEAATKLARFGLPSVKHEAWRYTSLASLLNNAYQDAQKVERHLIDRWITQFALNEATSRIVFINGRYDPELSPLGKSITIREEQVSARGDNPLIVLNDALSTRQISLTVHDNVDAGVVQLVALNTGARVFSSHVRLNIVLGEGAKLTLLDTQLGAGHYLANPLMSISLAQRASLEHVRVQEEDSQAELLAVTLVTVAQDAAYDHFVLTLGARLSRQEVHVDLVGKRAFAQVNAVQILRAQQHADMTVCINHLAPEGTSRQTVKNVLWDRARAVFQGKTFVDRVAQKTDGYQMNRSLLLSEEARVDSKPELEIYADDVKCSHGATIGAIDLDQLFYLRARAISEEDARMILVRAFLDDALSLAPEGALNELLNARVAQWWDQKGSVQ